MAKPRSHDEGQTEPSLDISSSDILFFEEIEQDLIDARSMSESEPQILYDIASQVRNSFNLQDLFESILEHLNPAIPYDVSGGLLLSSSVSNVMMPLSSPPLLNSPQCQFFLKTHRTVTEEFTQTIQQKLLHTLSHISGENLEEYQLTTHILNSEVTSPTSNPIQSINSQVFVPLIVPSEQGVSTIGLLFVGSEQTDQFSEENIRLLYFAASHVAMAAQGLRSRVALEQLAGVISNLQDGVLLLDKNQSIVLANGHGKNYLALLAEMGTDHALLQLGGKPLSELMRCPREDSACREVTVTDHPERVFEIVIQPISPDSNLEYWVVVIREVSERKQFERKIQAALNQARALNDIKSRVLRTVSHEYRSPLTTILLASETLERRHEQLSDIQKHHFLERIRHAAAYMTALVDDMLLVDQAESGKLQFHPVVMNLDELCHGLIEEMQLLGQHNHAFTFSSDGNCGNLVLDPMLIRQILTNLLSNALKFSPQGGLIELMIRSEQARILLLVRDEGIGIPTDEKDKVFESFYRAANVDTIEGTGLGLDITRKFVELHQGAMSIDSSEGRGTTVTIEFPRVVPAG